MQNQFYGAPFPQQQTFNMKQPQKTEGCYQISPFGVVLQPVSSMRPHPITVNPTPPASPLSPPPMSPAPAFSTPKEPEHSRGVEIGPISLSPLSCGGYVYHSYLPCSSSSLSPQSPPQPPPMNMPQPPNPPHFQTNAPQFVSTEIAARQEKLEKYREKRLRRNYNRPVDQGKRERACARTRDPYGHFASEAKREQERMRQALEASQRESMMLRSKLSNIELELALLRQKAEEATSSKEHIQSLLEAQQQMNQALLRENTLLWSTVPSDEVFNTSNPNNPPEFLDAFKQKIDFSTIELNWTDSPLLEAARMETLDFEQRWEDMELFAGARS
jgi:hypothetical protein